MSYYEKTALTCYNALEPFAKQIEISIKRKAKNSFYNYSPCLSQAEEILKLVEARLDLLDLKSLIDEAFTKISTEDEILIKYKYLGIKPDFEFDHTSRNYFRKQIKALNNFKGQLEKIGVTETWFENKYLKIAFIKNVHKKIILEDGKKHCKY